MPFLLPARKRMWFGSSGLIATDGNAFRRTRFEYARVIWYDVPLARARRSGLESSVDLLQSNAPSLNVLRDKIINEAQDQSNRERARDSRVLVSAPRSFRARHNPSRSRNSVPCDIHDFTAPLSSLLSTHIDIHFLSVNNAWQNKAD